MPDARVPDQTRRLNTSGRVTITYDARAFATQDQCGTPAYWQLWPNRLSRYATYWAHYEATIYQDILRIAESLKEDQSLYEFIRSIYSPANRLGEFWATHIWGGALDPAAGDGTGETKLSAVPILTKDDSLRAIVAKIWKDSNFTVHKETIPRFGAVMGDVYLVAEDDIVAGKVRFRAIDPRIVRDVVEDSTGNVRGYTIQEMRPDPRYLAYTLPSATAPPPYVTYTEICERDGEDVVYQTYLDEQPWDWSNVDVNGTDAAVTWWRIPYGFVPMVHIQHKDLGIGYGTGEFFALTSKLTELDDQASKLGDYVRKCVDSPWLFAGINAADMGVDDDGNSSDEFSPNSGSGSRGRSTIPIIYASDPNAKGQPLIAPLDIAAVSDAIARIYKAIEAEHPELTADLAVATGDASGRALRVAREKAEALVTQRRTAYDDGLVRIHQMCVSIGAYRGYAGYEAFSADSYANGDLDHTIGARSVFALNEFDRLEEESQRAAIVKVYREAGMPLVTAMQRAGFPEAEIAAMKRERDAEMEVQLKQIQVRQVQAMNDGASYGVAQ